jgi:hypothetical protein
MNKLIKKLLMRWKQLLLPITFSGTLLLPLVASKNIYIITYRVFVASKCLFELIYLSLFNSITICGTVCKRSSLGQLMKTTYNLIKNNLTLFILCYKNSLYINTSKL